MNYWCDSQSKADYSNLLKQNENNYQEELREKYNPDNIFKKTNQTQNIIQENISNEAINDDISVSDNVDIIEYKESIFKKIIDKIKSIFHMH